MAGVCQPIAAIATAPGMGGIGVVRVSGQDLQAVLAGILGRTLQPRQATACRFLDEEKQVIDQGIALWFPAPHSFTGESVLELQGHGGPVVLQAVLVRVLALGARLAEPGEFSKRAFLNQKIDLLQAEAIADLIEAQSLQAVKAATRSLTGQFSAEVEQVLVGLIALRVKVESMIDFPEEAIEINTLDRFADPLADLLTQLSGLLKRAQQGVLLREGCTLAIVGPPNVGKSSLLNRLTGEASAIVSAAAGTTRDLIKEVIQIDGLPIKLIDTAGFRLQGGDVENEGMRRAQAAVATADHVLWVEVATADQHTPAQADWLPWIGQVQRLTVVRNKSDLVSSSCLSGNTCDLVAGLGEGVLSTEPDYTVVTVSAKTGAGFDSLVEEIKRVAGFQAGPEPVFIARQRHREALLATQAKLKAAEEALREQCLLDVFAEMLSLAQQDLASITGAYCADDLLGEIFSTFCIGK